MARHIRTTSPEYPYIEVSPEAKLESLSAVPLAFEKVVFTLVVERVVFSLVEFCFILFLLWSLFAGSSVLVLMLSSVSSVGVISRVSRLLELLVLFSGWCSVSEILFCCVMESFDGLIVLFSVPFVALTSSSFSFKQ